MSTPRGRALRAGFRLSPAAAPHLAQHRHREGLIRYPLLEHAAKIDARLAQALMKGYASAAAGRNVRTGHEAISSLGALRRRRLGSSHEQ
jgi:hypothetical protein